MNIVIITGLDVSEVYHSTWYNNWESIRKRGIIRRGGDGFGREHIYGTIKSMLDTTPDRFRMPTAGGEIFDFV